MITQPPDTENNLHLSLIVFNSDIVKHNKDARLYFNLPETIKDTALNKVVQENNHIIFMQHLKPYHILVIDADRSLELDLKDTQESICEQLFDFAHPDYAD